MAIAFFLFCLLFFCSKKQAKNRSLFSRWINHNQIKSKIDFQTTKKNILIQGE
jgi:hypothetical protein